MYIDETILPKIWQGRIDKYWDLTIPTDYPISYSEFAFVTDPVDRAAVKAMEAKINTEESVLTSIIPENSFVSGYAGTYDVLGEPGVETLLSPNKITINSGEEVLVLHYLQDSDSWEKVPNTVIRDGYVYGVLDNFSPISVFKTKKDIVTMAAGAYPWKTKKPLVCANGNPIKVIEEDGVLKVTNLNNNKVLEFTSFQDLAIVGGSIDGSDVDNVMIYMYGITAPEMRVYSGSVNPNEPASRVGKIYLSVENCKIRNITGSSSNVKTGDIFYDVKNSDIVYFIGAGESTNTVTSEDANEFPPSLASNFYVKNVVMNLENVNCNLTYIAPHSGYSYTLNAEAYVKGGKHDYLLCCPSNGLAENVKITAEDAEIGYFQTTNRNIVRRAEGNFINCKVENLFITGDNTDETVTGTVDNVRINIDKGGEYYIKLGNNNGVPVNESNIDIVEYVKISRSARFEISVADEALLGSKLIIK